MGYDRLSPIYTPSVMRPQYNKYGGAIGGRVLYVRQSGAPEEFPDAFGTLTAALAAARDGDTIVLLSDLREEVTGSNTLFDITIVGNGTTPRHDDKHNFTSTFHMGSASWRNSSGVTTTPLITVRGQGWRFINIMFDVPTTASAVKLESNALSGESEYDASHASFYNCRFDGGQTGIQVTGGAYNVQVERCIFRGLTDGILCDSTSVRVPAQWYIVDNQFYDNTHNLRMSLNFSTIRSNSFDVGATSTINVAYNASQGGNNHITGNSFNIAGNDFDPAGGVEGHSTDVWSNILNNGIETGQPAN
jgi:hypothetical protein